MKYLQVDLVGRLVLQTQGNQWAPGDKDNTLRFTFLKAMQNCHCILLIDTVCCLTDAPCVPLPPFRPATPIGPCTTRFWEGV